MKLQKINKYVAAIMASFVLVSTTACSTNDDEIVVEDAYYEQVVEPVTHSFRIPDYEEIRNAIDNYENLDTTSYVSNMYKVLEFADKDQYYRVMVVGARVDYITMDGKVIGNKYTVFDIFTKEDLLCTTNLDTFEDIEFLSEFIRDSRVLSYSSIDKLGDIARNMGAPDEYIKNVMQHTKQMSDMDAAIMYISLIPASTRVNINEFEYGQIKKIG